jgi:hypothetical protein
VQDKSIRYKIKMMSHQKARKEVCTRKDYGEARKAKRAQGAEILRSPYT